MSSPPKDFQFLQGFDGLENTIGALRGWLRKQGEGKLKGWKKRYFKLVKNNLFYFQNENDPLEAAFGCIDMSTATEVYIVSETEFDIVTVGRVYHLSLWRDKQKNTVPINHSELKAELTFWVDAISYLIEFYKEGNVEKKHKEELMGLKPLKGYLKKFGEGTLRGWKKRYFRQEGENLYYYYSETDKDSLGFINLAHVIHVEIVSEIQFELVTIPMEQMSTMQRLGLGKMDLRKYWNPDGIYRYQLQILGDDKMELQSWVEGLSHWVQHFHLANLPTHVNEVQRTISKDALNNSNGDDHSEPAITQAEGSNNTQESTTQREPPVTINPEAPLQTVTENVQVPAPSEEAFKDAQAFGYFCACVVGVISIIWILPFYFSIGIFVGLLLAVAIIFIALRFLLAEPKNDEQNTDNITSDFSALTNSVKVPEESDTLRPDLNASEAETYIWLVNYLLSRVLRDHLHNEGFKEKWRQRMNERLKGWKKMPAYVENACIKELDFGNNTFEIVNGVKVLKPTKEGELRILFYMKYSGDAPAGVTGGATIFCNWPASKLVSVTVEATVTLEHLSGPVLFIMPPGYDPVCTLSFTSEPVTKWKVDTKFGNHVWLKNIPSISQLIVNQLNKRCRRGLMIPNGVAFHIPIKNERQLQATLVSSLRESDPSFGPITLELVTPTTRDSQTSKNDTQDPVLPAKVENQRKRRDSGPKLKKKRELTGDEASKQSPDMNDVENGDSSSVPPSPASQLANETVSKQPVSKQWLTRSYDSPQSLHIKSEPQSSYDIGQSGMQVLSDLREALSIPPTVEEKGAETDSNREQSRSRSYSN